MFDVPNNDEHISMGEIDKVTQNNHQSNLFLTWLLSLAIDLQLFEIRKERTVSQITQATPFSFSFFLSLRL